MANRFNFQNTRREIAPRTDHDDDDDDDQSNDRQARGPVSQEYIISTETFESRGQIGTNDIASSSHAEAEAGPSSSNNNVTMNNNDESNMLYELDGDNGYKLTERGKVFVVEQAKTQKGSKFLQNSLMEDPQAPNAIYQAVDDYMFDVIADEWGNHVFARLLEHCTQPQLENLVRRLINDTHTFVVVVRNKHGAQSVKKLIKVLEESPLLSQITSLLSREFTRLMANRTASYIILKCFQLLNVEKNKELYVSLVNYAIELATNETACVALNESINYVRQPYRDQLFHKIANQARYLSQDPSGNYVVQKVLGMYNTTIDEIICSSLRGYFVDLSNQKASSHVVEKCLESELLGMNYVLHDFLNDDKLWRVARNHYGNYVVQKALKTAKKTNSPYYEMLVRKLYRDREKFQNGYGKNVYAMVIEAMRNFNLLESLSTLVL